MIFFTLAFKSLRNRRLAATLTVVSIALSVTLLLAVENARQAAEESFTQSISQTDLIVGPRTSPLQLVLYTVFNMGNATHTLSYKTYEAVRKNPAVAWTIPYSLGDGHRGFRVVGTTADFFVHYRFRGQSAVNLAEGAVFSGLWDVVVGSEVAKNLKYRLSDPVVIEHGVTHGAGIQKHQDKPFHVVGILQATGTAIDQSLYISLHSMEAIHLDWQHGAAPARGQETPAASIRLQDINVDEISAVFVGAKSRIDTLRLQRELNEYPGEALLAIVPGVTLSELWHSLSYVGNILKVISFMVVLVGFMAMLIALTTTLNERRREMAILRSIGASGLQILSLLVFEAFILSASGIVLGVLGTAILKMSFTPWLASEFGFYLPGGAMAFLPWSYLIGALIGGLVIGLIPGLRALRSSLKDGLSVKV